MGHKPLVQSQNTIVTFLVKKDRRVIYCKEAAG